MHNQHRILRVLQLIAILQKEPAKSIRNLATLIDNTERTIYRYLDLIKALGFDLQRDAFNKYFIANNVGCRRKYHIRRGRCNNDEVNVPRLETRCLQCVFCSFKSQITA